MTDDKSRFLQRKEQAESVALMINTSDRTVSAALIFLTALIIILIPELSISKGKGCSALQISICQSLSRKFERIFNVQ